MLTERFKRMAGMSYDTTKLQKELDQLNEFDNNDEYDDPDVAAAMLDQKQREFEERNKKDIDRGDALPEDEEGVEQIRKKMDVYTVSDPKNLTAHGKYFNNTYASDSWRDKFIEVYDAFVVTADGKPVAMGASDKKTGKTLWVTGKNNDKITDPRILKAAQDHGGSSSGYDASGKRVEWEDEEDVDSSTFSNMDSEDTPLTDDRDMDPTDADMSAGMDPEMDQLDSATSDLADDANDDELDLPDDDEELEVKDDAEAFADAMGKDEDPTAGLDVNDIVKQILSTISDKLSPDDASDDELGDIDPEVDPEGPTDDTTVDELTPEDPEGMDSEEGGDITMTPLDDEDGDGSELGPDESDGSELGPDTEEDAFPEEEEESFDTMLNTGGEKTPAVLNQDVDNGAPEHAEEDLFHLNQQMDSNDEPSWQQHKEDLKPFITAAIEKAFSGDMKSLNASVELLTNLGVQGPVFNELLQMQQSLHSGPGNDLPNMNEGKDECCDDVLEVGVGIDEVKPFSKEDKEATVKVPAGVKSSIKSAIKEAKDQATNAAKLEQDYDASFNEKVVDVLEYIDDCLGKDEIHFTKAAHYVTTLMSDLTHRIPNDVYDFLSHGGNTGKSLRDYFTDAKNK